MRTRQLEVFHAVYTKGTITEAAKYLHVSQPSVSKVLAHTESQLGFLLFSRIKGRLTPTPEADIIFSKADKIHQDLAQLNLLAKNILQVPSGLIRLACTPTLGIDLVPSLVSKFTSLVAVDISPTRPDSEMVNSQAIIKKVKASRTATNSQLFMYVGVLILLLSVILRRRQSV